MDPFTAAAVGAGVVLGCLGGGILLGWGLWGKRVAAAEDAAAVAIARAEEAESRASARAAGAADDLSRSVDRALAGDDFDRVLHTSFGGAGPDSGEPSGAPDSGGASSDSA